MQFFYLDTNPLLRWAETEAAIADQRAKIITANYLKILNDAQNVVAISEMTLLEYQANLCEYERNSGKPQCNDKWADSCMEKILELIRTEKLHVLPTPPRIFERAMIQVQLGTREKKRGLKGPDALHLLMACDWARDLKLKSAKIQFVTSDADFEMLEVFPAFKQFIDLYDPSKP